MNGAPWYFDSFKCHDYFHNFLFNKIIGFCVCTLHFLSHHFNVEVWSAKGFIAKSYTRQKNWNLVCANFNTFRKLKSLFRKIINHINLRSDIIVELYVVMVGSFGWGFICWEMLNLYSRFWLLYIQEVPME